MPDVGDFAVTATRGWVARGIRVVTRSPVNHAVIHVGDGRIVQGNPNGANDGTVDDYPDAIWSTGKLNGGQVAADWAITHLGTPYSWLDCAEIAWVDLRMRIPRWLRWIFPVPRLLRRDLKSTDHLMCSALVAAAFTAAGVDLFRDGRPEGAVSPGDLYDLIKP